MSVENPLWGAPRIHGELLKLGFEVSQSSVAKYMVRRRGPPSQGWRAFLRNHAPDIAAMDVFVVPTIGFELLYAFVIVRLDRRDLIWSAISYATALHEIGHILGRHQRSPDTLVRERWAWRWAKENALIWTPAMEKHCSVSLAWYEVRRER